MSDAPNLHRGHAALLRVVNEQSGELAVIKGGTVQIGSAAQDFLIGWYEDLKRIGLVAAQEEQGRHGGVVLGERVSLTAAGTERLAAIPG